MRFVAMELGNWLNSYIRERTSTPLYPTLLSCWGIFNWQVVYVTLFVSTENLPGGFTDKLTYVEEQLNFLDGFLWPILLAAFFIFVFPHASNFTYKESLKFRKKRIGYKNDLINKHRMVTREEHEEEIRGYQETNRALNAEVQGNFRHVERAQAALSTYQAEDQKFKILHARYGLFDTWTDVHQEISTIQESQSMNVINENYRGDPKPGSNKQLIVVYRSGGQFYSVSAIEGDEIRRRDNLLEIIDGANTVRIKKETAEQNKKLQELSKQLPPTDPTKPAP